MSVFTSEKFARLEPWERALLMRLQMSPAYGGRSGFLPDDCSDCGACGEPTLGVGWCDRCSSEYERLRAKAEETR